jgi:putative transposase
MPNTYTQLYIQLVFAVKYRQSLINESFREILEKYICGIISNNKCKPIAIYCMPDHAHILVGLDPQSSISNLVRDIKSSSSVFVNQQKLTPHTFRWQEGFGAFSYSRSSLDNVVRYILNQKAHHAKQNFKHEYLGLLNAFEIEYKEQYLFEWIG